MTEITPEARRAAPLATRTALGANATKDIAAALTSLLADVFTLYLKTKNFHWHVSGPRFRSLHLMFDEHAGELLAMVDDIAERARKVGGPTLRSVGHIARLQTLADNDADYVTPGDMVAGSNAPPFTGEGPFQLPPASGVPVSCAKSEMLGLVLQMESEPSPPASGAVFSMTVIVADASKHGALPAMVYT